MQWGTNNDGDPPVIVHSLVSPPGGGGLITSAQDSLGANLPGAEIQVAGPTPSTSTQTLYTDSNGCAVFGGLEGGTYTVTTTAPTGYLTSSSGTTSTQSVIVVNGNSQTLAPVVFGQPGTAQATFQTFINSLVRLRSRDSFSLSSSTVTPTPQTFGTAGGTATSPVSSAALSVYPSTYSAYAGSCSADDPAGSTGTTGTTGSTGATPAGYQDPPLTVAPGGTGSAVVTVPTMLIQPTLSYAGSGGSTTEYNDHSGSSSSATSYTSGTTTVTYSAGWTYSGANYTAQKLRGLRQRRDLEQYDRRHGHGHLHRYRDQVDHPARQQPRLCERGARRHRGCWQSAQRLFQLGGLPGRSLTPGLLPTIDWHHLRHRLREQQRAPGTSGDNYVSIGGSSSRTLAGRVGRPSPDLPRRSLRRSCSPRSLAPPLAPCLAERHHGRLVDHLPRDGAVRHVRPGVLHKRRHHTNTGPLPATARHR